MKIWLAAVLMLPLMLASCSNDDDIATPNITGAWENIENYEDGGYYKIVMTFNADNTGTQYVEESYMSGDQLSIWDETNTFTYVQKGDLLEVTMQVVYQPSGGVVVQEEKRITKCRIEGNKLYNIYGLYPDGSEKAMVLTRK